MFFPVSLHSDPSSNLGRKRREGRRGMGGRNRGRWGGRGREGERESLIRLLKKNSDNKRGLGDNERGRKRMRERWKMIGKWREKMLFCEQKVIFTLFHIPTEHIYLRLIFIILEKKLYLCFQVCNIFL